MNGCASRPGASSVGSSSSFGALDIAQIVPGKTTRNDLDARFGMPHRVSTDAEGREVHDYPFHREKREHGKFEDTQVYSHNVFVLQPNNVPQWKSGRWTHEAKRLRVTFNADKVVDAFEVVD